MRRALAGAPDCVAGAAVDVGSWYVSCVRTRFGVHFYKICAGDNIHNNRALWLLRQALNKTAASQPLNKCRLLKLVVAKDVLVYSCLSLRFDESVIGIYLHSKVCGFVYKKGALTLAASFSCPKWKMARLVRRLSSQLLSSAVTNSLVSLSLDAAMLEPYIFDTSKTVGNVLAAFCAAHSCKVSVQRSFIVE